MAIHKAYEGPSICKALPLIARHFIEQSSFPVHNFIVRDRKDEILSKRVHHAEGNVVLVVLAVYGIEREVVEHVVHPAHVPLHRESETIQVHWPRDARKSG